MSELDEIVPVRFSLEGKKWVQQKADEAGVSRGRYIRKVVLGEVVQADVPFDKKNRELRFNNGITQADMQKIFQTKMPRANSNLNQISRRLNSGEPIDDKMLALMRDIQEDYQKIARTIIKALR